MSSVRLEDLSRRYGRVLAVAGVSLDIREGEFVALLGPSGCGKTTTLRMIAGFIEPTGGRIGIGTRDVTRVPPHQRNTRLVFQNYALFPHMNVAGNVGFGLEMRGVGKAEIDRRVKAGLDRVRLADYAHRMPRELSGGQQQRVALARALVIEPEVLLLDEPLSNLDTRLRADMRDEIRSLQKALGLTTILVTHDQDEAMAVADLLVVMNAGRIAQIGTPAEVFEAPRTRFVADFIGVSNLLAGRSTTQGSFVLTSGERIHVGETKPARDAVLALRPDRLQVMARPSGQHANEWCGRIRSATYLGSMLEYYIELPSGTTLHARHGNVQGHEQTRFQAGDAVCVAWPEAAARLVDAD